MPDSVDFIVCKNCGKRSLNNHYGFCSIWCCVDFAARYNMHYLDLQKHCASCYADERGSLDSCDLEEQLLGLQSDKDNLYDEIRRLEGNNAIIEERENALALQSKQWEKKYKKAQKEIKELSDDNKDLILAIRTATSHSERFQLLIFGNEDK